VKILNEKKSRSMNFLVIVKVVIMVIVQVIVKDLVIVIVVTLVIVKVIVILKGMAMIRIKFFLLLMVPKFNGHLTFEFLHSQVVLGVQLTWLIFFYLVTVIVEGNNNYHFAALCFARLTFFSLHGIFVVIVFVS